MMMSLMPLMVLGLVGCGTSATKSISTGASTGTTAATTETETATATATTATSPATTETTTETSASTAEEGPLTIAAIDSTLALPSYSYASGVYTFNLQETAKTGAVLSGTLTGYIKIVVDSALTDNASMELDLNGVTITSVDEAPIYYASGNSKLVLKADSGTTNALSYTGTSSKKAAVLSDNNLEISGKGTLNLSGGSKGHGIKCDTLTLSSATAIAISETGNDGIHAKKLAAGAFTGTLAMGTIASQAFDVNDYDTATAVAGGALTFPTGTATFTVTSCAALIEADNNFTITAGTTLTATTVTGDIFQNLNSVAITVTIAGTVTANGTAVATQDIAAHVY
jgi:hypothetical protein